MLRRPNLNRYFLRWVVRSRAVSWHLPQALGGLFLACDFEKNNKNPHVSMQVPTALCKM